MRRGFTVGLLLVATAIAAGGCGLFSPRRGTVAGQITTPTQTLSFDFERDAVGSLPRGFAQAVTGGPPAPAWKVVESNQAAGGRRVLAQISDDPTGGRFPVCVNTQLMARDLAVTVKFLAISGKVDQAGGVVVRYRDANNYYVARANVLEDNVRFYKVQDGKRTQLAGLDTKVAAGAWHKLSLRVHGKHFTVSFDGKSLEADDATFATGGFGGLWTKADSVTYFDDLTIEGYDPAGQH
jgi:hypothetical protein